MFRKIIATLAIPAAALAVACISTAASASTPGCAAAPGGFCGSQQVTPGNHLVLMMAATSKPGIGTKVEVKTASGTATATGTNATEDFVAKNPPNPLDNSKVFQYAPNGVVLTGKGFKGGLCVTASDGGAVRSKIVLWPCVNGVNQQWVFTPEAVGGTWRLRGSSYVLTDPNGGAAYTQLQIRNDWDGANQQWTAIYPPAG